MAKGQKRSNKEIKKPKQNKDKKSDGSETQVANVFRTPPPKAGKSGK